MNFSGHTKFPRGHLISPRRLTNWMRLEKWLWPGHRWLRLSMRQVCESGNNWGKDPRSLSSLALGLRVEVLPEAKGPHYLFQVAGI